MTSTGKWLLVALPVALSLSLPPGATVGIDLGTTNSAVSILRDGVPSVVPNSRSQLTTPSVVAYMADGRVLVGDDALEQSASNALDTVHAAKRFIGRPYERVKDYARIAGVSVEADSESGAAMFNLPACDELLSPEAVSAALLGALLDDAERATGVRAQRAVITVPAYFDDRQCAATRAAAVLAGVADVSLLAEPVAACLAHQADQGAEGAEGLVLVFDLGAGTFDVSVLRIGGAGSVEVVATSGDARLGGNDFDAVLLKWAQVRHLLFFRPSLRDPPSMTFASSCGRISLLP